MEPRMDQANPELEHLLTIIEKISGGDYSNEIMNLTTNATSEPIRSIAEAMGMMMVKVEAREFRLEQLIEELRQLNEQIRRNTVQTIAAMAQALEARDAYTRGHAERVASLAAEIASEMGQDRETVERVRAAALLHDIGKIGCSDRIFQDHGPKNPPEVVKEIISHPTVGAEILGGLEFLDAVTAIVHAHHEQLNGKGYPRGLDETSIPMEAKIIAVADGFDAMTTDRPYQKARPEEAALDILRSKSGSKWDSTCVAALERILARKRL